MTDEPLLFDARYLDIGELSLADKPAQEGAVAPILKRHNPISQDKEIQMSKETQTELDALRAEVETLKADAARFKALDGLTAAEHAYYTKAEAAQREAFLGMTPYEREAAIKAADAAFSLVYVASDGTQYTKADDSRLVELAKARDADRKELEAQKAALAEQELQKRAAGYSHLPGTPAEVVTLLKAVDTIEDGEARDRVIKMLNAHDGGLARSFKAAADVKGGVYDDSSAQAVLEKMVAEYAKEHQVSRAHAYSKVLHTQAGSDLYAKHLAE